MTRATTRQALDLLDAAWPDPVRPRELSAELGVSRRAAYMLLAHQVRRGRAERIGFARYRRIIRPLTSGLALLTPAR